MASQTKALKRTFSAVAVRRSLTIALLIGTVLNTINQGPEVLTGHWPIWWKLLLTYSVPFCVASYGSYAAFRTNA